MVKASPLARCPARRYSGPVQAHKLLVLHHALQGLSHRLVAAARTRQALEYLVDAQWPLLLVEQLQDGLTALGQLHLGVMAQKFPVPIDE